MSNHLTITGNLGRAPELRYTHSGAACLTFNLADTPRRRNTAGEWEDAGETLWVECAVWGDLAEHLGDTMPNHKGRVTVTGRLGQRTYDAKDGTRRTVITCRAEAVALHPARQPQQPSSGWGQQDGSQWATPTPADDEPPF